MLNFEKIGMSTLQNDLDVNVISDTFVDVVHSYLKFLQQIFCLILKDAENVEINKRKFNEVKEELYTFLVKHKKFFNVKNCEVILEDELITDTILFDYSQTSDDFFTLDDFLKHNKNKILNCITKKRLQYKYTIDSEVDRIIERVKLLLEKQNICNEDIKKLLESRYLLYMFEFDSNCTNYYELSDYINKRNLNYCKEIVCIERIEEFSFEFNGSIEGFEDQICCGICMNEYEINQQICKLPCNHFACRKCIEVWFEKRFQCPFCRNDCT